MVNIVYEDLQASTGIKDSYMDELMNLIETRYSLSWETKEKLSKKIRKVKLAEKRAKAKQRTLNKIKPLTYYIT